MSALKGRCDSYALYACLVRWKLPDHGFIDLDTVHVLRGYCGYPVEQLSIPYFLPSSVQQTVCLLIYMLAGEVAVQRPSITQIPK